MHFSPENREDYHMKFSNGCWLQKERCECFSPAEVYFSKIEKDQVTICAPTSKITQRGDTLGGINLTIVISAPYEEVLRFRLIITWACRKRHRHLRSHLRRADI